MINNQEEATLKGVVGKLAREVENLIGKLDGVVTAQEKVDSSLKDIAQARRTGTPVQYMRAEVVEKTITEKLNTQLVASTVKVEVNDPVASIDKKTKDKISNLISATERLVESNKTIKTRRPLFNNTEGVSKYVLIVGVLMIVTSFITSFEVITWTNKKMLSFRDQAFFWGNRAYEAAVTLDEEDPGYTYHLVMSYFQDDEEKVKKYVEGLEARADIYRQIKAFLKQHVNTVDVRVLKWEKDGAEWWILYRHYDDQVERSVHIWPSGEAEETTEKAVRSLEAARMYSKRRIWTPITEKPSQNANK